MGKPARVYWDTCAWIGLLNGEPDKKRDLESVYTDARNGKTELWTSTLSMVECRFIDQERETPRPYSEEHDKTINDIFRQPFVKPISLTRDIAEHARHVWRATPSLGSFQDAVHLVSALKFNVDIMHTYDKHDLLHLSEQFTCRNGNPLVISNPSKVIGTLFDNQILDQTEKNA